MNDRARDPENPTSPRDGREVDHDPRARRLVLASASPRRREILGAAGLQFVIEPSTIDETPHPGEAPAALVERLAREKALDVAGSLAAGPGRPVLGADTIVVLDGEILGKPRDSDHAVSMLSRLVGRGHEVLTGIALAWTDGRALASQVVASRVVMRAASRQEIVDYVALGESLDKAGAYALQGGARRFVTEVVGSSTNVIGLPLEETLALLDRSGARRFTEPR
ncbi:MAG: Maf family protein [Thermoleophilia bacterium]|nr:Maf family protein [Thermoleophilia bacterium]